MGVIYACQIEIFSRSSVNRGICIGGNGSHLDANQIRMIQGVEKVSASCERRIQKINFCLCACVYEKKQVIYEEFLLLFIINTTYKIPIQRDFRIIEYLFTLNKFHRYHLRESFLKIFAEFISCGKLRSLLRLSALVVFVRSK